MRVTAVFILGLLWLMTSCVSDISEPDSSVPDYVPTPYSITVPTGFPDLNTVESNVLTLEGIQLGRLLFYDSLLHPMGTVACASCHSQSESFSNYNANSRPHVNLGFTSVYLGNGKIEGRLEDIMLFEVEEFFKTDVSKFNSSDIYPELFRKAMGVSEITSKDIAYALAQFESVLISSNSKWDRYLKGQESLSAAEQRGFDIYFTEKGDCFHCHGTALFTDNDFHNNGLDQQPENGREEITGDPQDIGKFKSPTLRNIELTAPYMHDGRFQTLEEVIDFYSEEVQWSSTIDPLMKNVHQGGVQLNAAEKNDLLQFLKTFTDTSFVNDTRFSDPF